MEEVAVIITNPRNGRKLLLECENEKILKRTIETAIKKGDHYKVRLPKGPNVDIEKVEWALEVIFNMEHPE